MDLAKKIFEAGVVGAGGAGFPTHIKAGARVDFVLANGAECEPLIHKDYEFMLNFSESIVGGMKLMVEQTNAKKGYFGLKSKNVKAIDAVMPHLKGSKIEMSELGDFYPAGDEYELVYSATKRLIPPAGIPLDVGCVVNNVETLHNIKKAEEGIPVTEKFICVTGAVKKPSTFFVPIGTSFREILDFAGGPTVSEYGMFSGGVMMGALTFDLDEVITKTSTGFIVLPKSHYLIKRKNQPEQNWFRIGKSACDQCSYCTEFCPRYLLGYNVQPHKVMRSLGFTKTGTEVWNQMAELCCACGLCTLYACPEDLYPKEACDRSKKEMRSQGIKYVQQHPVNVHPIKEGRRVPLKMLIKKLNLQDFDSHTPYNPQGPKPSSVTILLKQHVGEAVKPQLTIGAAVKKGDVIGRPAEGKLGSVIHASIDGIVSGVNDKFVRIQKSK